MPLPQLPSIKLPAERITQLKDIAAALGLSSPAEVVGHMVRAEIAKGTIPDTLPGVNITATAEGVAIALDDQPAAHYGKAEALNLATVLDHAANGGRSLIDLDADFIVARVGNGIKVNVPLAGQDRMLSRDLARDLARLIRSAAK